MKCNPSLFREHKHTEQNAEVGAFANLLRRLLASSCVHASPSIRMEQHEFHWTYSYEILALEYFFGKKYGENSSLIKI